MDMKSVGSLLNDIMTWFSAAGVHFSKHALVVSKEMLLATFKTQSSRQATALRSQRVQRRRLMSDEMPLWLSGEDRKLLQNTTLAAGIKADVVVAKDGSGKYKKISDAFKAVPEKSKKRFVIYVMKGVYYENVMMIGDGMYSTIVSASLNVVDGTSASFGSNKGSLNFDDMRYKYM
ncbi:putative pectinesterase/pectinesterase inhibitor 24 [Tanacetum coccineum]